MRSVPILRAVLLSAQGLTRTYRLGTQMVTGISEASLSLDAGEFAVLAGPSGSGKTTLLNCLGLLDTPDSGTLVFEGRDVSGLSDKERARVRRERLGFVFQNSQLIPVLTAEENVSLALWIREYSDAESKSRAREALAAVGLGGMEDRKPDALSGGQRQRVAVARAIVGKPALILADEPTASLDSETSRKLLDLFDALHTKLGVTFLFSSHDPRMIERAARRIDLLDGKIVSDRVVREAA